MSKHNRERRRAYRPDRNTQDRDRPSGVHPSPLSSGNAFKIALAMEHAPEVLAAGCIACGRPASHVGVFVPTKPEANRRMGAPAGKVRLSMHGVCDACAADPDGPRRIEEAILAGPQPGERVTVI
jgi:hypothetical protein